MKPILSAITRFLGNMLTVLCALVVALLLAEWIVRIWMPSPDYGVGKRPAIRNQLFMYDELLGWKGSPNAQSRYVSKDFIVHVSHDALGYRNLAPPFVPGKRNILLLGDSYGWGWGVEDNETAAAVLNATDETYNAYSLGIPGYGTDQQYLALQRLLTGHPDYRYSDVFVLFYLNDFNDVVIDGNGLYPKPLFKLDNSGQLQLHNVPVPKNDLPPVSITEEAEERNNLQRSQLFNLALDSLGKIIFDLTAEHDASQPETVTITGEEQDSIAMTDILLQKIRSICQEKNMRFHVVFLMTINTDEKPQLMIAQLAKKLEQNGIAHSFVFSKMFPRTDLWLDTHYTPYGQKRLAHHIAEILEKETAP